MQRGTAEVEGVVEMVHEPGNAPCGEDAAVAGADDVVVGGEDDGAATVEHGFSGGVKIGAGDLFGAADGDFVGAVNSTATEVEGGEEIKIIAAVINISRFDCSGTRTAGEGIKS